MTSATDMVEQVKPVRGKIGYIESIRGIGALCVCFAHFVSAIFPSAYPPPYADDFGTYPIHLPVFERFLALPVVTLAFNGTLAVCLFFVLSGLALTSGLTIANRSRFLLNAAVKRYPRLVLPVVAAMAPIILLIGLGWFDTQTAMGITGGTQFGIMYAPPFNTGHFALEALKHAMVLSGSSANPVLWTMKIELFGSLILFFYCYIAVNPLVARWVPMLAVAFCFAAGSLRGLYYCSMVIGSLIGALPTRRVSKPLLATILLITGLALGCIDYSADVGPQMARLWWGQRHGLPLHDTLSIIAATLIVWAVSLAPRVQSFLDVPMLRKLGRLSFPVYLLHYPLLASLGLFVFLKGLAWGYAFAAALAFVVWLCATYLLAEVFSKFFDIPAQFASRWIARWLIGAVGGAMQRAKKKADQICDRPG